MKVEILETCTACGHCSAINSQVFIPSDGTVLVNNDMVDYNQEDCLSAAEICPVGAISIYE